MDRVALLRYGLLGLPLAFLALPLYVQLPNLYAREFGVPLATLGWLLLAVRALDAVVDPWLGVLGDKLFARSAATAWVAGALAAALVAGGFAALWLPPAVAPDHLLAWVAVALVATYLPFSLVTMLHQAWGAMLGGGGVAQSRLVGWREGMALAGVLLASVLPGVVSRTTLVGVLAALLAAGLWAWHRAPRPQPRSGWVQRPAWWRPLEDAAFRRLLAVFVLNGIATALPATLVLFYVQDRLRAPAAMEPLFLGLYFAAGALSVPAWLRAVAAFGLVPCWRAGMLMAVALFSAAATLGPGDAWAFAAICALSGFALGADLAIPGALLASVIAQAGEGGKGEGVYLGWWNFAAKLNFAAAAGLALPLLALAGYRPGTTDEAALDALAVAYGLLPCALKVAAAFTLPHHFLRPSRSLA
jgi:glycoside/pentoside/hexuronide:cation symporter, GPH family